MNGRPLQGRRIVGRRQHGVSMLFALIALVVLTLGAVALVRSVDSGLMVMGNLGFKQSATSAAAVGADQAVSWLQLNRGTAVLDGDVAGGGYYPSSVETLNPTAPSNLGTTAMAVVDWEGNGCNGAAADTVCLVPSRAFDAGTGQTVRYVITRLCPTGGEPGPANNCVTPLSTSAVESSCRGEPNADLCRETLMAASPYYRIYTRVVGVRGTISFTETLVHF
jgi:type IV pilus assembly protein PilX